MDKEQQIRLQFLDEATEYLDRIESGVLGLSEPTQRDPQILDAILRAAHSIKGGAAMMGYNDLSELAHRLEDFFKIIKAAQAQQVNREIESLLLDSVDNLRQCVEFYRQGRNTIEPVWLETKVNPHLESLHSLLGDVPSEPTTQLSVDNVAEDMISMLFETEVEGCLQRLEDVLNTPEQPCLKEEFSLATQELGGLGEMLDLSAFTHLCQSIRHHLDAAPPEQIIFIAQKALDALRRSQSLILVGQKQIIPSSLDIEELKTKTEPDTETGFVKFPEIDEPTRYFEPETEIDFDTLAEIEPLTPDEISLPSVKINTDTTKEEIESAPSIPLPTRTTKELSPTKSTTPSPTKENTLRVSASQLEKLSDLVGELIIERNGLNLQMTILRDLQNILSQKVKTLIQSNTNLRTFYDQDVGVVPYFGNKSDQEVPPGTKITLPNYVSSLHEYFDYLELDRYNELHLFFQELMETIVQVQEVSDDLAFNIQNTQKTARNFNRTSQLIQNQVTQLRMRPFSDLVGRFPRTVRDMCFKYGKQVQLNLIGTETLIDRTILETLKAPLLHLVRNAFAHGIEDSQTRLNRGKPSIGTIAISAIHRGNQTLITVKDDGGGIDLTKIREKALAKGLEPSEVEKMTKSDLLNLIFEPGFSTAEKVTDLSGRGIGMDILRTQVQQIRGQIQVDTKPGKGTTFTMIVPFTLSVVRVLLVESGGMMLAFPCTMIEEMIVSAPSLILTSAGQKYLNWDNYMLPLVELNQHLRFSRRYIKHSTDTNAVINQPIILIINQGNTLIGIQVDSYWGEEEVTIRAVSGPLKLPKGFSGCTILGDGRVVPLVDPFSLLQTLEGGRKTLTSDTSNMVPTSHIPNYGDIQQKDMVMVVDDSINVRRFLSLTLEKAGYRIQDAKDGQEALDKLKEGLPIKAIICDIEMPRLDGYGFLAQVKSDPMLSAIPVMMLTSRSGEKHRKIAFNLGATAYFSKPFQEQELIKTLKSVINQKLTV